MNVVKSFALIFLITVLVVAFQNCSPKPNTGLLVSKTTDEEKQTIINDNTPFGFDIAVDTISYNSCVGENLVGANIHGIKIGVNEGFTDTNGGGSVKAGVKLRSELLHYAGKVLKPSYPAHVITPGQVQYLLANSNKNSDSYIQYAVRKKSDLKTVIPDQIQAANNVAPQVVLDRDGFYEKMPLQSENVLRLITKDVVFAKDGTVLSEGPRVYNIMGKSAPTPIQATFAFNHSIDSSFPAVENANDGTGAGEEYADRVRKRFNGMGADKIILAVTFGNPNAQDAGPDLGLSKPKLVNSGDNTKAYGVGFELKFEAISAKAGWRDNHLKQVREIDLSTGGLTGLGWTCESFVIMKKDHWNNSKADQAACVPLNSNDMQNPLFMNQVKRLRRHYSEKDWKIGLYYGKSEALFPTERNSKKLCLVPSENAGECYLRTAGITGDKVTDIGVNYDPGSECYLSRHQNMGVTYTGNAVNDSARSLGRCPQYASICVRINSN